MNRAFLRINCFLLLALLASTVELEQRSEAQPTVETLTVSEVLSRIKTKNPNTGFAVSSEKIERCKKDPKIGCNQLAQSLNEVDKDSALLVFELSCNQGYSFSCEAAIPLLAGEIPKDTLHSNPRYLNLVQRSCDRTSPNVNCYGCEKLADYLIVQGKTEEAREMLQSLSYACSLGNGRVGLAKLAKSAGEEEFSCALVTVGCLLSNSESCAVSSDCTDTLSERLNHNGLKYASDQQELTKEPESALLKLAKQHSKAGDLNTALSIYNTLCSFGYRQYFLLEKDDETSHLSEVSGCKKRDYLMQIQAEFEEKAPELERKCLQAGDRQSCEELSQYYSAIGKNKQALELIADSCDPLKDPSDYQNVSRCSRKTSLLEANEKTTELQTLLTALCAKKYPGQCFALAFLEHRQGNSEKALTLMSESCKDMDPASCTRRDIWLFKKSPPEVEQYLMQACAEGSVHSCISYGLFAKKEGKSELYRDSMKKALTLASRICRETNNGKRCGEEAALLCVTGDTRAGSAKFEDLCESGDRDACMAERKSFCGNSEQILFEDFKRILISQ